jgi:hypothetical protein
VFTSEARTLLDPDNLSDRVLAPACAEAGVEWAGFHTFRHTVASRRFAAGRNPVQVQRWLGHHAASFTLDTYVHLLESDLGEPLMTDNLRVEIPKVGAGEAGWDSNDYADPTTALGANKMQTDTTPLGTSQEAGFIVGSP